MSITQLVIKDIEDKIVKRSGKWFGLKCPFCGDSKHANKPHLWLMIDEEQDGFIGMKCFQPRCDIAGVLNIDRALKIGVRNKDVIQHLLVNKGKHTKRLRGIEGKTHTSNIDIRTSHTPTGLEYMFNRTGKDFGNFGMVDKFSYVGNVVEFLQKNWQHIHNKNNKMFEYITKNDCVCFTNSTRTRLLARTISDDLELRHIKIPLVDIPMFASHAPYTISQKIDVTDDYLEYHRFYGEGIFDVVNSCIHISGGVPAEFFGCTSFSSMYNIINNETLLRPNKQEVFIKDADITIPQISKIFEPIKYRLNKEPIVIYNDGGKDFGNIRDVIVPTKLKLKL